MSQRTQINRIRICATSRLLCMPRWCYSSSCTLGHFWLHANEIITKKHGTFLSLCAKAVRGNNKTNIPKSEDNCFEQDRFTCNAQTSRLLTLFFLAQFTQFFSPLLGALSNWYTPASLMRLTPFCALSGLTLLLVFVTTRIDELLYIAFPLNSIVAMSWGIMYVNTGMMFEKGAPRYSNQDKATLFFT